MSESMFETAPTVRAKMVFERTRHRLRRCGSYGARAARCPTT
jgi:hypothetical protein